MNLIQSDESKNTGYLKVISICTMILTFIAVTMTLFYLRAILVPFTLAIILYFILAPTVDFLERDIKVPRIIAISMAILGALALITLLALILTYSAATILDNIDIYTQRLQLTLANLNEMLQNSSFRIDISQIQQEAASFRWLPLVQQFTSGFMGFMGTFGLIAIFTGFLLVGKSQSPDDDSVIRQVGERVSKYLSIKFVVSLVTGLLVGGTLRLIGIEFAIAFGLLAFILNFIPNIGSIIATLLPLPVAFLEYGFGWQFASTLLIPGSIQMFMGNILEPRWLGVSLGLHPVVVLFFLFFWGIVWGLPGMFLSVPIMATLKFLISHVKSAEIFVLLLEGRIDQFLERWLR